MSDNIRGAWIQPALAALEEEIEYFQQRQNENVYNSAVRESCQGMILGLVYFHLKLTELEENYKDRRKKLLTKLLNIEKWE